MGVEYMQLNTYEQRHINRSTDTAFFYKETLSLCSVEMNKFILCFQAYLSDVQLIIQCNYIVIVLYLYRLKLISLYSYAIYAVIVLKQIMSVERPSTACLF